MGDFIVAILTAATCFCYISSNHQAVYMRSVKRRVMDSACSLTCSYKMLMDEISALCKVCMNVIHK